MKSKSTILQKLAGINGSKKLILAACVACSCMAMTFPNTVEQEATAAPAYTVTGNGDIYIGGSKKGEIQSDGDIYIGGSKKGEIQSDGDVYIGGSKKGEIQSDGDVYIGGSKKGEVQSDGDVYIGGSKKGEIQSDGDIYIGGSKKGECDGVRREWVGAVVFFFFTDELGL